jgi:predicted transcriptional regulator of viral defense system
VGTIGQFRFEKARNLFLEHGGFLRTTQAIQLGVHPETLYAMHNEGFIDKLSWGLYRLAELPPLGNPDMIAVGLRVPRGVFCLISALAFHDITTQIPHEVYVALPRGAEPPRLDHPPIRTVWFSGTAFTEGIETQEVEGVPIRVYSSEKTLADCFKYRNKLGLDTAMEALRLYRERRKVRIDRVMHYARVCRVEKVIRPYLESVL